MIRVSQKSAYKFKYVSGMIVVNVHIVYNREINNYDMLEHPLYTHENLVRSFSLQDDKVINKVYICGRKELSYGSI